jgi:hypothetical protein
MSKIPQEFNITIQIVKGGFLLHYPSKEEVDGMRYYVQEVFTFSRKLNQKIKEVLE